MREACAWAKSSCWCSRSTQHNKVLVLQLMRLALTPCALLCCGVPVLTSCIVCAGLLAHTLKQHAESLELRILEALTAVHPKPLNGAQLAKLCGHFKLKPKVWIVGGRACVSWVICGVAAAPPSTSTQMVSAEGVFKLCSGCAVVSHTLSVVVRDLLHTNTPPHTNHRSTTCCT